MSILIASLESRIVSLNGKVTLFTARHAAAKEEAVQNEATFNLAAETVKGDAAIENMVGEGYASLSRALKLKTAKLVESLDAAVTERDALLAEVAAKKREAKDAADAATVAAIEAAE